MRVRVPGDKSISQRALILAALAQGTSRLTGVLPAADPRSTAGALRGLGAGIPALPADAGAIEVVGRGIRGLAAPAGPLDLGNSGTGTRLLMGVLAAQPFAAVLDGDASLRSRPMARVVDPLSQAGARFRELGAPDRLPLEIRGGPLADIHHTSAVASAQVKSALLLAGACAGVPVHVTEPGASRDHTERMLRGLGLTVHMTVAADGRVSVVLEGGAEGWPAFGLDVPGDLSSAAFVLLAGVLGVTPGPVTVDEAGINPTRHGVLGLFRRMGADLTVHDEREAGGEPVASLTAAPSALRAVAIDERDVVAAIDEIPALAVAAARAEGLTRITGAGELRVKETDRIRALVVNLRAVGVAVEELDDGLEIEGTDAPLRGDVDAFHDHRIAMAFGVLGAQRGNDIRVHGTDAVEVSFPGFWDLLARLRSGGA